MNENLIKTKYNYIQNIIDVYDKQDQFKSIFKSLGIVYTPLCTPHELQQCLLQQEEERNKIPEFLYKFMPFPNEEKIN